MARLPVFIFIIAFIRFILFSAVNLATPYKGNKPQQENHAPAVKIISPQNNSSFAWNTQVIYTISVSDAEDGESKYDEINPREVLLKVEYVSDESKLTTVLNRKTQKETPGLASMVASNCFNCHKSANRSIGPSFSAITKKYSATTANITLLANRIRKGSSGIWGKATMPSHRELTKKETQNTVKWILQNGAGQDINYYTGIDGSFRIKPRPASKRKSAYILTAIYIDHGSKDDASKQHLKGQDIAIIHSR